MTKRNIVVFSNVEHAPYKVEIWAPHVAAIKWLLEHIGEMCVTHEVWSMSYEDGKFVLLLSERRSGGAKTKTFVHRKITTPAGEAGFPVRYLDQLMYVKDVLREENFQ